MWHGVAGGSDDVRFAMVESLTSAISDIRASLEGFQTSLLQLQENHDDLLESHADLQESFDALRADHRELQQHALTLSGSVSDVGNNIIPSSSSDLRRAPSPNSGQLDRRELFANQVCDEYSDAQLVVEGSGVFVDDVMVGDDEQTSIMGAVYASSETAGSVDTLRGWLCRPQASTDVAKAFHTISPTVAFDVEHFRINSTDFVAVANFRRESMLSIQSAVYRYAGPVSGFELFQAIDTHGARDWEYFRIGDTHFLAVANFKNDTDTFEVASVIYRYNNTAAQFEPFQEVATLGARAWEHFEIGQRHLLAVANYRSDASTQIQSVVYEYNETTSAFEVFQFLNSSAANGLDHFRLGNSTFLALANYYDGDEYATTSVVYVYNAATNRLETFQEIGTIGAAHPTHFRIGDIDFLAIANMYDGDVYEQESVVHRYNKTTAKFEPFQAFSTTGGRVWEHFSIGASDFLAIANTYDGEQHALISPVYQYNTATQKFELQQEFATTGARVWKHFRIGDLDFLALGEYSSSSTPTLSLMLCNSFCFP